MNATIIYSPIVATVINLLRVAALERGEKTTVKALDRVVDYMSRDGGIPFEWECGEITLASSHSTVGGTRQNDSYVCTTSTCTCPAGESRTSAINYVNKVGTENAGKVVIRMCWHIQVATIVATLLRLAPIIGESLIDQALFNEPVLLELKTPVSVSQ